jgi:hypothetical protein
MCFAMCPLVLFSHISIALQRKIDAVRLGTARAFIIWIFILWVFILRVFPYFILGTELADPGFALCGASMTDAIRVELWLVRAIFGTVSSTIQAPRPLCQRSAWTLFGLYAQAECAQFIFASVVCVVVFQSDRVCIGLVPRLENADTIL